MANDADLRDLKLFCEGTDEDARGAFGRLSESAQKGLLTCVQRIASKKDDQLDILQEVFLKVYKNRADLTARSVGEFYSYMRQVARTTAIDWYRRRDHAVSNLGLGIDDDQEFPERPFDPGLERGRVHEMDYKVSDLDLVGQIMRQANVVWLGLDDELSSQTHTLQLLAAQLYYLDRESPTIILLRLNQSRGIGEPKLSREILDRWLEHTGVIRFLAFGDLYFDGDRLASTVLGERYNTSQAAPASGTTPLWADAEATVVEWYCRNRLNADEIRERHDCPLGNDDLNATIVRIEQAMPFRSQAKSLIGSLQTARVDVKPVGTRGLWQRLSFEYRCVDELTHKETARRVAEPAEEFGFRVSEAALNGWFSQHRLAKKLVEGLRSQGEEAV